MTKRNPPVPVRPEVIEEREGWIVVTSNLTDWNDYPDRIWGHRVTVNLIRPGDLRWCHRRNEAYTHEGDDTLVEFRYPTSDHLYWTTTATAVEWSASDLPITRGMKVPGFGGVKVGIGAENMAEVRRWVLAHT